MKPLPKKPSSESFRVALSELAGQEHYKLHIQSYIDTLENELKHLRLILDKMPTMPAHTTPNIEGDEKIATSSPVNKAPHSTEKHAKKTILIIDDDLAINAMIQTILQSVGYNVLSAETGQEGIDITQEYTPDLIICDIHLPGMHGLDLVRMFRQQAELANVPVLMLTADIFKADESFDIGADEYIMKPIRKNQLIQYVAKYLPLDETS